MSYLEEICYVCLFCHAEEICTIVVLKIVMFHKASLVQPFSSSQHNILMDRHLGSVNTIYPSSLLHYLQSCSLICCHDINASTV